MFSLMRWQQKQRAHPLCHKGMAGTILMSFQTIQKPAGANDVAAPLEGGGLGTRERWIVETDGLGVGCAALRPARGSLVWTHKHQVLGSRSHCPSVDKTHGYLVAESLALDLNHTLPPLLPRLT